MFILFLLTGFTAFAAPSLDWNRLYQGASRAEVTSTLGTAKEIRGETEIFRDEGEIKEVVAEFKEGKLASLSMHFQRPVSPEYLAIHQDKFELMKTSADLSRLPIRLFGLPARGWILQTDEKGKISSVSVGATWKSQQKLLRWNEVMKAGWKGKK